MSDLGRNLNIGQGARYLDYGLMESGSDERGYLTPPLDFTVHLRGRHIDNEQVTSLQRALIAVGAFGGIGARSRKGFGSLVIKSLRVGGQERWRNPNAARDLGDRIRALHAGCGPEHPPEYTALSKNARYVLVSSGQTEHMQLLDLIGRELRDAIRSCARQKRMVFGLPRGYANDRRASPLFIHVHECGDTPIAILSFLPARFLPDDKFDISAGGSRAARAPESDLYQPIHEFLDRLLDKEKRKEGFTDVIEIAP